MREFYWEKDGKSGTSTEIGAFVPADDVRAGKVRLMKKRELSNRSEATAPVENGFMAVETDELPF